RHLEHRIATQRTGVVSIFISRRDHQQAKAEDVGKAVCDQVGRARVHHAGGEPIGDAKALLDLLRQITGAANGTSNAPPRMQVSTAYGVLTLEAKWLVPAGALPEKAAQDPKKCLLS